jgi:uncharacterized protein YdhG (YjbR/CyaY superfamily)
VDTQVKEFIAALPADKKEAFLAIRNAILNTLPEGFSEQFSYGMIGYVVPLERYPEGYLDNSALPLPIMNLGCQKQYISLYHYAVYSDEELKEWFMHGWREKGYRHKPDMGKSCIRFRYPDEIPLDIIEELAGKISVDDWIRQYEASRHPPSS